jgi:hypothetical protein
MVHRGTFSAGYNGNTLILAKHTWAFSLIGELKDSSQLPHLVEHLMKVGSVHSFIHRPLQRSLLLHCRWAASVLFALHASELTLSLIPSAIDQVLSIALKIL